jgi:hypothetical protein
VLTPNAEQVAAKELRSTVRVDGFLAPVGDRREGTYTSGMYSGKRHRCGFNLQVVGSHHGTLVLVGTRSPAPPARPGPPSRPGSRTRPYGSTRA